MYHSSTSLSLQTLEKGAVESSPTITRHVFQLLLILMVFVYSYVYLPCVYCVFEYVF